MAKIRLGPAKIDVPVLQKQNQVLDIPIVNDYIQAKQDDELKDYFMSVLKDIEIKMSEQVGDNTDLVDTLSHEVSALQVESKQLSNKCDLLEKLVKEQNHNILPVETKVINLIKTDNEELQKVHKDVLSHIENVCLQIECQKDRQIAELHGKINSQNKKLLLLGAVGIILLIINLL